MNSLSLTHVCCPADADPKIYVQIEDMGALQRVVEEYLEDYNSLTSSPMKLVMFLDAIEHVARVCRVIRTPLGNALLLGVGGSGRQSLTRLAVHMEEFELCQVRALSGCSALMQGQPGCDLVCRSGTLLLVSEADGFRLISRSRYSYRLHNKSAVHYGTARPVQIEISKGYGNNEWRDDLRKVLKKAGVEGKDTVFLFADTQIVWEGMLEDINNILNSGALTKSLLDMHACDSHELRCLLPCMTVCQMKRAVQCNALHRRLTAPVILD